MKVLVLLSFVAAAGAMLDVVDDLPVTSDVEGVLIDTMSGESEADDDATIPVLWGTREVPRIETEGRELK